MFRRQQGHSHGGLQRRNKIEADSFKDVHMWGQKHVYN
jgi:hypothetical protein